VTGPQGRHRTAGWLVTAALLTGCAPVSHVRPERHRSAPASVPTTAAAVTTSTAPTPPGVIFHGRRDRPWVALTFDSNLTDGMIAELDRGEVRSFDNHLVVAELIEMHVPATIFLAGKWMERYPDEVRLIASNPDFELASHSYSHRAFQMPCYGLGRLPLGEMAADVERSEALLAAATLHPTRYFRFPGGCYDRAALAAIASTGVTVVQWDVASGDAFGHSVRAIVRNVLSSTQPGSIVVMHITGGNTAPLTAEALPQIVDGLRAQGFTLVKLSDLLAA